MAALAAAPSGHSVLQLPVAELEEWVLARTRHYDASFVSADPRFGHAHVTALGPFDPDPSDEVMAKVARVAAKSQPIEVVFADVAQFPDGIIYVRPVPDAPLRELTGRLVDAFPDHPPYAGIFGPATMPHLTLDAASPAVSVASTRELLGDLLPVACRLEVLQLAWWQSGGCRVMAEWDLGAEAPD